jgi:hypothetical protein
MKKMVRGDPGVVKKYLEKGSQGRLEVRGNCVLIHNADPVRTSHHVIAQ